MKNEYYAFMTMALIATGGLFYFFWSPFAFAPLLIFGIYAFCLRCPCCKRRTLKKWGIYVPWIPHACDGCGCVYD
jgi:hypothetical protein